MHTYPGSSKDQLCNVKEVHSQENVWRKIVKTLNLPLHMHALHIIIVQENDNTLRKISD